jgi:hypothetical protein
VGLRGERPEGGFKRRITAPISGLSRARISASITAGDSNLYRYVNNVPTIFEDPSGLQYWYRRTLPCSIGIFFDSTPNRGAEKGTYLGSPGFLKFNYRILSSFSDSPSTKMNGSYETSRAIIISGDASRKWNNSLTFTWRPLTPPSLPFGIFGLRTKTINFGDTTLSMENLDLNVRYAVGLRLEANFVQPRPANVIGMGIFTQFAAEGFLDNDRGLPMIAASQSRLKQDAELIIKGAGNGKAVKVLHYHPLISVPGGARGITSIYGKISVLYLTNLRTGEKIIFSSERSSFRE